MRLNNSIFLHCQTSLVSFQIVGLFLACLAAKSLIVFPSKLLKIVEITVHFEQENYIISMVGALFVVGSSILSFLAVFAEKDSKWIIWVSF